MGFWPTLCGLPMLHMTILSKGKDAGSFLSCASISPALVTMAPRTAYSIALTLGLMVSTVIAPISLRV